MLSKEHLQLFRDSAEAGDAFHANTVKALIRHIDKLQEDYVAQGLALKAAKAMQQAETERADANELDARRYRWLREQHWVEPEATFRLGLSETDSATQYEVELDSAIDSAISTNHATIQTP